MNNGTEETAIAIVIVYLFACIVTGIGIGMSIKTEDYGIATIIALLMILIGIILFKKGAHG